MDENRRSWSTIGVCLMAATFEGIDLQAAGVAAPRLLPLLHLKPSQAGAFFSASTLGLLIGAPLGGWLADRLGRKTMLVASMALFGLFSIGTALVGDLPGLILMRFLTGIGLGGALPNMIALASENAPKGRKSLAVGLMYCGMPTGGALASLVSLAPGADWKTVFYFGGLAPLFLTPVVLLALKDSYRERAGDAKRTPLATALAGEGRIVPTLLLWTSFGFTLLILYLLLNWLPSLLISRGLSKPLAAEVQMIFNIGGVIGSAISGRLMDTRWRLATVAGTFAVTLAGLFLLAGTPGEPMAALGVGLLVGIGIMANQSVLYAIAPLCYPLTARGSGVGAAVAIGRVGSLVGPLLAGLWLGAGKDAGEVLQHLTPILMVGALAALVLAWREERYAIHHH
jgi:AAHS family 3-hydroxyphenylpropionic acid transporter